MEDQVTTAPARDTSQAMKELIEYRAGDITLAQLADIWAKRKWDDPVKDDYDNYPGLFSPPGSWQDVIRMKALGQLTSEEYGTILDAVFAQNPKT
jgi:hypothetical protein